MPVNRTPPYTRSRSRRSQSEEPLLGVVKHPVAPFPISPSPFANITLTPSILDPSLNQYIRERAQGDGSVAAQSANRQELLPNDQQVAATPQGSSEQQGISQPEDSPDEQQQAKAASQKPPPPPAANQGDAEMANHVQIPPALQNWDAFARVLLANRPSPPEFHGRDHEDPEAFITRCAEYFAACQTPEAQRTQTAEAGLGGLASQWWDSYRPIGVNWVRFQELLRHRFDSIQVRNALMAQLYTKKQGEKELVGTFLQQKYLIYQRLRPEELEATKLATMVGLLRPTLKKALRLREPTDFADLLTKALEAEKEEAEDIADQRGSRPKKEPVPEDKKPAQRSLPQCWFCPGQHYNRDCEVRKAQMEASRPTPENWRAAAETPAAPAKPAQPRQ